ncbi:hypothetical protein E2C01_018176 [Portunus trituberculatus]|uniref:Uncharacterized protein n=1 Tax=Portunus trituberculatus TaxID=210409 RepID=A0A5B7DVG2_PORTR|nr:hypothetical protein [Portunus trituberculatus]
MDTVRRCEANPNHSGKERKNILGTQIHRAEFRVWRVRDMNPSRGKEEERTTNEVQERDSFAGDSFGETNVFKHQIKL